MHDPSSVLAPPQLHSYPGPHTLIMTPPLCSGPSRWSRAFCDHKPLPCPTCPPPGPPARVGRRHPKVQRSPGLCRSPTGQGLLWWLQSLRGAREALGPPAVWEVGLLRRTGLCWGTLSWRDLLGVVGSEDTEVTRRKALTAGAGRGWARGTWYVGWKMGALLGPVSVWVCLLPRGTVSTRKPPSASIPVRWIREGICPVPPGLFSLAPVLSWGPTAASGQPCLCCAITQSRAGHPTRLPSPPIGGVRLCWVLPPVPPCSAVWWAPGAAARDMGCGLG